MPDTSITTLPGGSPAIRDGLAVIPIPAGISPADALRQYEYMSTVRGAVYGLWAALDSLRAAGREWTALDYGATLGSGIGRHEGITSTDIAPVVSTTLDALLALLAEGHSTNLARLL